jgi:hypothetical protein
VTQTDLFAPRSPDPMMVARVIYPDLGDSRLERALLDPPRARNTDPVASHEAAEAVATSGLANAQAERVLEAVTAHPGLTSLELEAASGIDRYVLARRLPELRRRGFVVNLAPRPCRLSPLKTRSVTTWAPLATWAPKETASARTAEPVSGTNERPEGTTA